jgi:hypothetical protein
VSRITLSLDHGTIEVVHRPDGSLRFVHRPGASVIGAATLSASGAKKLVRFLRHLAPVIELLARDLREIDADERFHYPTANTDINAPLALIQLNLETKADYAQRLLKLLEYDGPELSIRRGPRVAADVKTASDSIPGVRG